VSSRATAMTTLFFALPRSTRRRVRSAGAGPRRRFKDAFRLSLAARAKLVSYSCAAAFAREDSEIGFARGTCLGALRQAPSDHGGKPLNEWRRRRTANADECPDIGCTSVPSDRCTPRRPSSRGPRLHTMR
jgi:hypothetical protein